MTELELLDRERRATGRPYPASEVPCHREPERFDFLAMPTLNKAMVLELARYEFLLRKENMLLLELHRWPSACLPVSAAIVSASPPPRPWSSS
jgi:hypothetical protein